MANSSACVRYCVGWIWIDQHGVDVVLPPFRYRFCKSRNPCNFFVPPTETHSRPLCLLRTGATELSKMSALFDLSQIITVLLLMICICTYVRWYRKGIFDSEDGSHHGLRSVCWKASRVGERLSPYVACACLLMAGHILFFDD